MAITTAGHNYPAGGEAAYAALERAAVTPSDLYNQLMSSDLGWASSVDEQGKPTTLDPETFSNLATSRQAAVRRAFDAYYSRLKSLEQSLGQLITRKYEIDRSVARARNFRTRGALLHFDHVFANAGTKQERVGLLAADLRRMFVTYVQGVVATDFEARLEDAVASGEPPPGAQVTRLYLSVLRDYYGGTLQIAELSGEEWMTLGPAYYGHVEDEWAFAIAGAVAMMERVKAQDSDAIAAIVSPMKKPDSFTSYDLLRDAGADPTTTAFYETVFRRMNADMDALDSRATALGPPANVQRRSGNNGSPVSIIASAGDLRRGSHTSTAERVDYSSVSKKGTPTA